MTTDTGEMTNSLAAQRAQLRVCSLLSFGLAAGILSRSRWGPLLDAPSLHAADTIVAPVALTYAVVSGVHAYVLASLNRFLHQAYGYRGADRAVLAAVALLSVDVLADLLLAVTGASASHVYTAPLGLIVISYSPLAYFGFAVVLIAFGYSLLRFPHELHGLLRPYAHVQILTGALMAAPPVAGVWPLPAAVGHVLLGMLFSQLAASPSLLSPRQP